MAMIPEYPVRFNGLAALPESGRVKKVSVTASTRGLAALSESGQ
jgi:hypothetical protein